MVLESSVGGSETSWQMVDLSVRTVQLVKFGRLSTTIKIIKIPLKIRTYRNSCMFERPSRKPVQNSQLWSYEKFQNLQVWNLNDLWREKRGNVIVPSGPACLNRYFETPFYWNKWNVPISSLLISVFRLPSTKDGRFENLWFFVLHKDFFRQ